MFGKLPDARTRTMIAMAAHLCNMYESFANNAYGVDLLTSSCKSFSLQYGALQWALKPKLHLLQEMCEYLGAEVGSPREFWCYKDEDFDGLREYPRPKPEWWSEA